MRSWLFVPGDAPRKLEKAFASAADVVIVDFADAVAPDRKAEARRIVGDFVKRMGAGAARPFYIRLNPFGTGLLDADLESVGTIRPHGVVLPGAVGLPSLERLSSRLRVVEARGGLADGSIRILPIATDTAAGLLALPTFARGHERLSGIAWRAEDLAADLGARDSRDPAGRYTDVFGLARANTLLAASAAGCAAIDTGFVDFRDGDGLSRECVDAERDGFLGKLAIHPDQVEIINAAFTPSARSVDEARAIVAAFAAAGDAKVVGIAGKTYDRLHLKRAQRLVARESLSLNPQPRQGPE